MLRRSLCCQHKLAFSRSNWYNLALKAILPNGRCLQRTIQLQYRATATVASALDEAQEDDTITSTTSEAPLLPLLEPLTTITTAKTKTSLSTSVFKRCSGYKKCNGQQCKRLVKIDPKLPEVNHYYCFNHNPNSQKERQTTDKNIQLPAEIKSIIFNKSISLAKEKGIFEAPSKIYDCWQLWIGDHIQPKHKSLIKQEMKRPLSDRDKSGYIYAYHLEDGPRVSQMDHAYFKIGRTTDPHRRMYQVTHACNFIPKIIELFPSFPKTIDDTPPLMSTNLETRIEEEKTTTEIINTDELPKCPMSHRVERLIHLELASLYSQAGFKCDKCGSTHREWIKVDRRKHSNGRLMTDQELWTSDIRPIVLRWIQFGVVASALK